MKKLIDSHTQRKAIIFTMGITALALVSAFVFFFFNGDISACFTVLYFSGFIMGFVAYIIQPAVYLRLVAKEKRKLLKEEVRIKRELSDCSLFLNYRWAPPNLYDLENRLAEIKTRLAELGYELKNGFEQSCSSAPTTKVVSVNQEGIKRFLGWDGTTEDLKRLKLK